MKLIGLDEAFDLDMITANKMYDAHLNKYLLRVFKVLGLDEMDIVSAEGLHIRLRDGRIIRDFSGGIGICGLGHNHPRIIEAERKCHERKAIDLIRVAPNKLQGVLAHNIAQMLPDPLNVSFLAVSGSEAVEAALKLCERAQGQSKTKFICMEGGFHGKTHGTLSVTTAARFQRGFMMGIPAEHVICVPFGDLAAFEAAVAKQTRDGINDIIAAIVEPIRGEAAEVAPEGFLTGVVDLCRKNNILSIIDEVKTGMGRTGKFCAFQHENVVPDIVTMAKALGGAKRAIGAMITSQDLFDRAYGHVKDCTLHSSGFGGLGESCAVAIEAINTLVEEDLIAKAAARGEYFRNKLLDLQKKHAGTIIEVRGKGLFLAVRFDFNKRFAQRLVDIKTNEIFRTWQTVLVSGIVRELYEKHDTLVHFQPGAVDIIHFMPPYFVTEAQIDDVVAALDDVLSRGLARSTLAFIQKNIARMFERQNKEPLAHAG